MPTGESGRIFVGNDVQFEGYTGGGNKDEIDGLLSSGDVGHFDDGRAPVHRRPRRRHDRLRRRERLPGRGRGPAAWATRTSSDVAVFGVDDEKFGQRLKAVDRQEGLALSEKDVKDYVKANLAGYKAPRDVVFIDELPRTSTGKVLKRELKDAS